MLQRLAAAEAVLAGTEYSWSALGDCVAVRCPWGNIFLVWEPGPAPSRDAAGPDAPVMESFHCGIDEHMAVRPLSGGGGAGIRFVQFQCAQGAPAKIGDFYTRTFSSRCTVSPAAAASGGGGGGGLGEAVAVCAGPSVHLIFTATLAWPMSTAAAAAASGIHICLYISNFSAAYAALQEQDLIWCLPCPRPPAVLSSHISACCPPIMCSAQLTRLSPVLLHRRLLLTLRWFVTQDQSSVRASRPLRYLCSRSQCGVAVDETVILLMLSLHHH